MNTKELVQQVIDDATEILCSMIAIKEPQVKEDVSNIIIGVLHSPSVRFYNPRRQRT